MPNNNMFYIVDFKDNRFNLYDATYSPIKNNEPLNGIYAYIAYEIADEKSGKKRSILFLRPFIDHESSHSGAYIFLKTRLQRLQDSPLSSLIENVPNYGGEIVFFNSDIVCWNFKSKSYSQKREDNDVIKNEEAIQELRLPFEFFLYAWESDNELSKDKLKSYFFPSGAFKKETILGITNAEDMRYKLEIKPDIKERLLRKMKNPSITSANITGNKKRSDTALTPAHNPFALFTSKEHIQSRRYSTATCSSMERKSEDLLNVRATILSS